MRLRADLKTARSLGWPEWRLLAEAVTSLVVARLAVWFVPFRRLAARLGEAMAESPTAATEAQHAAAAPIGWAVGSLGERLPGMRQCLVQAVAATWMLQRRRIPSTLYFGLAKDEEKSADLKAHAWVRCGTLVLTGEAERHDFTVVASFAAPGLNATSDFSSSPNDDLHRQDAL